MSIARRGVPKRPFYHAAEEEEDSRARTLARSLASFVYTHSSEILDGQRKQPACRPAGHFPAYHPPPPPCVPT